MMLMIDCGVCKIMIDREIPRDDSKIRTTLEVGAKEMLIIITSLIHCSWTSHLTTLREFCHHKTQSHAGQGTLCLRMTITGDE